MPQLVVTPEQAQLLHAAQECVEVVDLQGNRLGFLAPPIWQQELALARQRAQASEPRYTTDQVLERLRSVRME